MAYKSRSETREPLRPFLAPVEVGDEVFPVLAAEGRVVELIGICFLDAPRFSCELKTCAGLWSGGLVPTNKSQNEPRPWSLALGLLGWAFFFIVSSRNRTLRNLGT